MIDYGRDHDIIMVNNPIIIIMQSPIRHPPPPPHSVSPIVMSPHMLIPLNYYSITVPRHCAAQLIL